MPINIIDTGGRFPKQTLSVELDTVLDTTIRDADITNGYPIEIVDQSTARRAEPVFLSVGTTGIAVNGSPLDLARLAGLTVSAFTAAQNVLQHRGTMLDFLYAGDGLMSLQGSMVDYPFAIDHFNNGQGISGTDYVLRFLEKYKLEFEYVGEGFATSFDLYPPGTIATPAALFQSRADEYNVHPDFSPLAVPNDQVMILCPQGQGTSPSSYPKKLYIRCPAFVAMGIRIIGLGNDGVDSFNTIGTAQWGVNNVWVDSILNPLLAPRAHFCKVDPEGSIHGLVSMDSYHDQLANDADSNMGGVATDLLGQGALPNPYGVGGLARHGVRSVALYMPTSPPAMSGLLFSGEYALSGAIAQDSLLLEVASTANFSMIIPGAALKQLYSDSTRDGEEVAINQSDLDALDGKEIVSVLMPTYLGSKNVKLIDLAIAEKALSHDYDLGSATYRPADVDKSIELLSFDDALAMTIAAKDTRWLHFFRELEHSAGDIFSINVSGVSSNPNIVLKTNGLVTSNILRDDLTDDGKELFLEAIFNGAYFSQIGIDVPFESAEAAYAFILGQTSLEMEEATGPYIANDFSEVTQHSHYSNPLSDFNRSIRAATAINQVTGGRAQFTELTSGVMAFWFASSRRFNRLIAE